ncbi:MAG: malate synthase A, partial [Rhodanobacteraceae bacterium]
RDRLLAPCRGGVTRAGFDNNIEVALRYLAAWLDGMGCVPIHHLMEDAATAEIARTQLWQWLHQTDPTHGAKEFEDGAPPSFALFDYALGAHAQALRDSDLPGAARAEQAAKLLSGETHAPRLADFLTLSAYDILA